MEDSVGAREGILHRDRGRGRGRGEVRRPAKISFENVTISCILRRGEVDMKGCLLQDVLTWPCPWSGPSPWCQ